MFKKLEKLQLILFSIILSIGIVFATMYATNSFAKENISVTGSAYEIVKSDSGKISFEIRIKAPTKVAAYQLLKIQLPVVKQYLETNNINDIEIKNYHGYYTYKYHQATGRYTNEVDFFNLNQPIEISSDNVDKIKELTLDIQTLLDKGVDININQTSYFYSKLSDLKIELLNKATIDAKNRASAMLKATNNKVGKIQSVKMGVFQITDVDSTNVSDMGINDTSNINKKVTAVANVVFKVK